VIAGGITLSGPLPATPIVVSFSSSNPGVATVPASITFVGPNANTTFGFNVTVAAVTAPTPVTISASLGGVTKTALLTVLPTPPLATGSMSAVMTVVPRPPQNDCGTGADAGNTLATATPITLPVSCTGRLLGLPLGGSVLDVDVDAYKFTVPQPFQQFSGSVT